MAGFHLLAACSALPTNADPVDYRYYVYEQVRWPVAVASGGWGEGWNPCTSDLDPSASDHSPPPTSLFFVMHCVQEF